MQHPEPKPSGLYAHTGYWLNRLRGLVHERFASGLAPYNVTVAQWSVLITVYRGEAATPGELARVLNVDTGAMTRLLDRLEAKGLVRRALQAEDRRRLLVELTPRARELTPLLAGVADANDEAFFGILSAEEHRQLRTLLGKLLQPHDATAAQTGLDEAESR